MEDGKIVNTLSFLVSSVEEAQKRTLSKKETSSFYFMQRFPDSTLKAAAGYVL
jgi:hypothetical protein